MVTAFRHLPCQHCLCRLRGAGPHSPEVKDYPVAFPSSLHILIFSYWIITWRHQQGKKDVHGGSKLPVDFPTEECVCVCTHACFINSAVAVPSSQAEKGRIKDKEMTNQNHLSKVMLSNQRRKVPIGVQNDVGAGYLHWTDIPLYCFKLTFCNVQIGINTHINTHQELSSTFLKYCLS